MLDWTALRSLSSAEVIEALMSASAAFVKPVPSTISARTGQSWSVLLHQHNPSMLNPHTRCKLAKYKMCVYFNEYLLVYFHVYLGKDYLFCMFLKKF